MGADLFESYVGQRTSVLIWLARSKLASTRMTLTIQPSSLTMLGTTLAMWLAWAQISSSPMLVPLWQRQPWLARTTGYLHCRSCSQPWEFSALSGYSMVSTDEEGKGWNV